MKFTVPEVEALYRAHGHHVLRRAERILGSRAAAEDALQEVFIRVLEHGDAFRREASPSSWIYRITTNYCLTRLRDQRRRRGKLADLAAETGGASASPGAERAIMLRQLLLEADPREAQAAIYAHVDEMSYAEIAPLLGVSKRTVGNLLAKFTARCAKRLEEAPLPEEAAT